MADLIVPKTIRKRPDGLPCSPELFRPVIVRRQDESSDAGGDFPTPDMQAQINQLLMGKLPLAYECLGVDPRADDAALLLLLAVLQKLFRGFQYEYEQDYRKPGRKRKWLNGEDLQLFQAAQKLIGANYDTDAALQKLNRDQKLGLRLSTLRKHYYSGAGKYNRAVLAAQKLPEFARLFGIDPLL